MKVLSLFDGISCARVALKKRKIKVDAYYASEIDPYAIEVSKKRFKNIIHLGDVKDVFFYPQDWKKFPKIDLLIGGSPCQDLSIAGKRKGLSGDRSGLFYEYVRILKETKPAYFVLENVNSMSNASKDEISKVLGIEPIMVNASLVSAQNRKRLFWIGKLNRRGGYDKIEISQPSDKKIVLRDIVHEFRGEDFDLEKYIIKGNHLKWIRDEKRLAKKYSALNGDKALTMTARQYKNWNGQYLSVRIGEIKKGGQAGRIYSIDGKSVALSALGGGGGAKTGLYYFILQKGRGRNPGGIRALDGKTPVLTGSSWVHNNHLLTNGYVRKLTPIECCRLQGLPDNYTQGISESQQYKALGNAFNADVIAHIFSFIFKKV